MFDNIWFFVALAGITNALGILLLTDFVRTGDLRSLILALIIYAVMVYAYIGVLTTKQVANAAPMIELIGIILAVFGGIILFKDHVTVPNIIGIGFAIVAIILIGNGDVVEASRGRTSR